ncbi:14025_t:CDS:2 [Entrophospora sp. SA101]|nr:14025_t:CDS:2 [Entrophospora sp. SA101]
MNENTQVSLLKEDAKIEELEKGLKEKEILLRRKSFREKKFLPCIYGYNEPHLQPSRLWKHIEIKKDCNSSVNCEKKILWIRWLVAKLQQ